MDSVKKPWFLTLLWRLAVSPVTFVVLSLLWCLDLALGSITDYYRDPQFWVKMDAYPFNLWLKEEAPKLFPHSLWVYILVGLSWLMVASLLLCTVNWFLKRRNRLKGLGEVLVHLGFLLLFAGFVLGSAFGARRQGIALTPGRSVEIAELGITLALEGIEIRKSPEGRPLDTVSTMSLRSGGREVSRGELRLNHPLIWGSTVVYPRNSRPLAGGVAVRSGSGAIHVLKQGESADLDDGATLRLERILQSGERSGSAVGPGALMRLRGADGEHRGSAYLSPSPGMRSSAVLGGIPIAFAGFVEETAGLYDVHRDPGVRLILAGALVLALGTLWALAGYLGLIPSTDRRDG